jgi:hypothetical protein
MEDTESHPPKDAESVPTAGTGPGSLNELEPSFSAESATLAPSATESFLPGAEPAPAHPTVGMPMTLVACLAGIVLPGFGHMVLRKWDRALVFLGSIGLMFALGLHLSGRLFGPDFSDLFSTLKFTADAGSGCFYWLCRTKGLGIGDPAAYAYDYGNVFIYTAGLLNMLVVVDTFDIARGRKP